MLERVQEHGGVPGYIGYVVTFHHVVALELLADVIAEILLLDLEVGGHAYDQHEEGEGGCLVRVVYSLVEEPLDGVEEHRVIVSHVIVQVI